jgi:hypothetical protein
LIHSPSCLASEVMAGLTDASLALFAAGGRAAFPPDLTVRGLPGPKGGAPEIPLQNRRRFTERARRKKGAFCPNLGEFLNEGLQEIKPNLLPFLSRALLGFESQQLSYRLPVKVVVLGANLIALNLNEGSPWIGDGATGRRGAVHVRTGVGAV